MKTKAKPGKRPAVFLDRDGTLIPDLGYLSEPSQVRLYAGTARALRLLREAGFFLFVVTNQSGVARGYFRESTVKAVHRKLQAILKNKGAAVDAFFYCPHYPGGKIKRYSKACDCRKPKTGMVKQALQKYKVDLRRSYVIGDKIDDLQLARNAKAAQGLLVRTGNGRMSEARLKTTPLAKTQVVPNLLRAAQWILRDSQK
jgi:D-glycero-D-manno-heptose 1,7-bisphosphate phosphatase